MEHSTQDILPALLAGFGDVKGIIEAFQILYPNEKPNYVEALGVGATIEELVVAQFEAFTNAILVDENSPHYLLRSIEEHVEQYLTMFDVTSNGADLLKYICAFGYVFEKYASANGERHLVGAVIRLNTVRYLCSMAAARHPSGLRPPEVMVNKVFKVWKEDQQMKTLGKYGTYMMFKAWAIGPVAQVAQITPKFDAVVPSVSPPLDSKDSNESVHVH